MSEKHHHDHGKHHHHHHVAAMSEPTITLIKSGPYHIRGKVNIVTANGKVVETAGEEIWLCRCGQSPNKPFCDGTHERVGFQSDLDAGLAAPAPEGYEDVCAEQDLPEGEVKGLKIGGNPVLLGRVGGQFYAIGADMRKPYYVCGGLQDNGSWCGPSAVRSSNGIMNIDWYRVGGGDGFYTLVDPTNWTTVYSESQDGNVGRLDLMTGQRANLRPRAAQPPRQQTPEQQQREI